MKSLSFLLAIMLSIFISSTVPKQVDDIHLQTRALEFFLQDQNDYKKHCPHIKWVQPVFAIYKADPKSYLPKKCKFTETENT